MGKYYRGKGERHIVRDVETPVPMNASLNRKLAKRFNTKKTSRADHMSGDARAEAMNPQPDVYYPHPADVYAWHPGDMYAPRYAVPPRSAPEDWGYQTETPS